MFFIFRPVRPAVKFVAVVVKFRPEYDNISRLQLVRRSQWQQPVGRGLQCESKIPPEVFWHFFPNGWEILVQILYTYYTFLSTL